MKVQVTEGSDDCRVDVTVTIQNQGTADGDEVAQLYFRDDVSSFTTPAKQLRAFSRIHLKAGESREVTFTLDKKSLALYMQEGGMGGRTGTLYNNGGRLFRGYCLPTSI